MMSHKLYHRERLFVFKIKKCSGVLCCPRVNFCANVNQAKGLRRDACLICTLTQKHPFSPTI